MSFGILPVIWLATTVALRPTEAAFDYLSWNNMKIEENRALIGNIFQTINEVRSRIECQSFCAQTNECKSYNYASRLKVCELNSVTKEDTDTASFREIDDSVYATLNYDNACTNKDCCLNPTTDKSKDTYCYKPDVVKFTNHTSSLASISVEWKMGFGFASKSVVSCSSGVPDSPVVDTADGSGSVECSCIKPGVQVEVTVVAVTNTMQSLPASKLVSTDDPFNVTLIETLIEDVSTNTSAIFAEMLSNAPTNIVYTVFCSTGDPFPPVFGAAKTTIIYCIDAEPGQRSILSVEAFDGNCSVGSASISISTVEAPILTSCDALKKAGFVDNGTYLIDPDGLSTGLDPFSVDCDMISDMIKGYTTIHHDKEEDGDVNNAEDPCESIVNIAYDLDTSQINAIKNISSSCRQFVKYACIGSCFHGDSRYHFWISVDGERMVNWGGVPTGTDSCACGLTGTCDNNEEKCNCDVNDGVLRMDQGYLTDKTKLPVSQLCFGDTGNPAESGVYTLGPLQCA